MHRHVDVYVDESGDLGYSVASTRHLVIVALATADSIRLERLVKSGHRRFKVRGKESLEFKFKHSSVSLRRFFLSGLASTQSWVAWAGAVKANAPRELRADKERFYGHICGRAISGIVRGLRVRSLNISVDRMANRRSIRDKIDSVIEESVLRDHCGNFAPGLVISHFDSTACAGLQIADFVAGAVFHSLERKNDSYLQLIAQTILNGELCW